MSGEDDVAISIEAPDRVRVGDDREDFGFLAAEQPERARYQERLGITPLGIFYNESSEVARGAWISEPGVLGHAGVVDRMGENADADQFGSAALGVSEEAYRKARDWH
ncbi:hypothetical protein [Hephaestia caeni]|uniref:hypothetical protein n=1 Tax=Hephaestia caeni TaxID=645617 RepID=UPI001472D775|nr:hypothetical protein [Hephaestia caeni]